MSSSVLLLKKGWQLIGSSISLDNMSKFKNSNVEQVWHFDGSSQKWFGYSSNPIIQKKIDDKNISKLEKIKSWHGFWIKSNKDWALSLENKSLKAEPIDVNKTNIIELKKGWNLISLPVDMVVSANIFDGMTLWKYNHNRKWELFDKDMENRNFPKLQHIKNSDGIWIKSDRDRNISVEKEALKLHNFDNVKDMKEYILNMATIYQRPYCGIEPFIINRNINFMEVAVNGVAVKSDSALVQNATTTNLQEKNVDEADILKHNDKYIFYIGDKNGRKEHINVTSFSVLSNLKNTKLETISFEDNYNINSFYILDNKLIVLSIVKNQTVLDIFDITDITNIQKIRNYKIDGYLKNSRLIGKKLYLISSFYPQYTITYPKEFLNPSSLCKDILSNTLKFDKIDENKYINCHNIKQENGNYYRFNYDKPNIKMTTFIPNIEGTNLDKKPIISPSRIYVSSKQNQKSSFTTISSFDLDSLNYLKSTSFVGDSNIEYASSNALYLVSYAYPYFYNFNNYKQRSTIYKFNFDDNLSYGGVGFVYGKLLNQFSLSEYNNILRVATTEGFSWTNGGTKNTLYTLKESNKSLKIEGILSGLGKENETIKSVRFMGDRAYIVTFKITDPLYTIDLTNPKEPTKKGELSINGYSAYLHPIGNNLLLGVGRDTDILGRRKGVKIELFDVSDFDNPTSLSSIILPNAKYSQLEYNHKALAYRSSDNLFAFGYNESKYISNIYQSKNYLGIYQIKDNLLKSYEPLLNTNNSWGDDRGLIFDLNNQTYVSFFHNDFIISKILTKKEK